MLSLLLLRAVTASRQQSHPVSACYSIMRCLSTHRSNYYEVLGLDKNCTQEEIKNAFLSLSKKLHPDKNAADPNNHAKFVRLLEAYSVLKKPMSRYEYDLNLAAYITQEQQSHKAYRSHSYGSSAWPGNDFDRRNDPEAQAFWDETIWSMRDKTKDKEYEGKPYYGINNVERVSNNYIMLGVITFAFIGAAIHAYILHRARNGYKKVLDEKNRLNHAILAEARHNARTHGNLLQLKILESQLRKKFPKKSKKSKDNKKEPAATIVTPSTEKGLNDTSVNTVPLLGKLEGNPQKVPVNTTSPIGKLEGQPQNIPVNTTPPFGMLDENLPIMPATTPPLGTLGKTPQKMPVNPTPTSGKLGKTPQKMPVDITPTFGKLREDPQPVPFNNPSLSTELNPTQQLKIVNNTLRPPKFEFTVPFTS